MQVQIGSEGTTFELLIDTGANDLWVASSACTSCSGLVCTPCSKTSLSPADSTLNVTGNSFSIACGSGGAVVSGNVVTDTVSVDGLVIVDMSFGLATTIPAVSVRSIGVH